MPKELADKIYDTDYYFDFMFKLMTSNMNFIRDPEKRKDLDAKIQLIKGKVAKEPMFFLFYIHTDLTERDYMILMWDEERMVKEISPFFEFVKFLQHPKIV